MKSIIQWRNPTDCPFRGTVRVQIDLPMDIVAGGPVSEQGWAFADGGTYTLDGLTYRRSYFVGTLVLPANTTYFSGINWTLADLPTLRTVLGAEDVPQRWSVLAPTARSVGWRMRNPGGSVTIDGATAHTGGYQNTLRENAGFWIHSHQVAA